MKTILVPTDFSMYGFNATRTAASLAEQTHAKIVLQHNVQTLMEWSHMTPGEHREHMDILDKSVLSDNKLNELMGTFSLRHLNVSKVVTQGITYEEIINEAKKDGVDIIVLGSHGNEQHDRFFIGSNIQKVLREAPCPVMTVNREIPYPQWKKVVVPLSFDEDVSHAFLSIKKLALELGSTIHLLYVNTPQRFKNEKEIRGKMQGLIHQHPELKFETAIYNHQEIENGIIEYSHDIKADWIAMVTHNRNKRQKYLIGKTETIAFKSDIPLLAVTLN
jgi:nucleotide-binding universal stress UspA family protein